MTYGNGIFVAVAVSSAGADRVALSADGVVWRAIAPTLNVSPRGVVFASGPDGQRGAFVTVGVAGSGTTGDPNGGYSLALVP